MAQVLASLHAVSGEPVSLEYGRHADKRIVLSLRTADADALRSRNQAHRRQSALAIVLLALAMALPTVAGLWVQFGRLDDF